MEVTLSGGALGGAVKIWEEGTPFPNEGNLEVRAFEGSKYRLVEPGGSQAVYIGQ